MLTVCTQIWACEPAGIRFWWIVSHINTPLTLQPPTPTHTHTQLYSQLWNLTAGTRTTHKDKNQRWSLILEPQLLNLTPLPSVERGNLRLEWRPPRWRNPVNLHSLVYASSNTGNKTRLVKATTANHLFQWLLQPTGEPEWEKGTSVDSNLRRTDQLQGPAPPAGCSLADLESQGSAGLRSGHLFCSYS